MTIFPPSFYYPASKRVSKNVTSHHGTYSTSCLFYTGKELDKYMVSKITRSIAAIFTIDWSIEYAEKRMRIIFI